MAAQIIAGVMVLLGAFLGARMGLGAVARQILATLLALALATYLAPVVAKGLQAWLPYWLVWFSASLLLFFLAAIAAHRAMNLFGQAISVPRWLSRSGGAVLMGAVGALAAGLVLWTIQVSAGLNHIAAQTPPERPAGLYAWASKEVELLTRWSMRASGLSEPVAASLGMVAAEPGFYGYQVVGIAVSPELRTLWQDPAAQSLLQQKAILPLIQLPSAQQLLNLPMVAHLQQALPVEAGQGQALIMAQLASLWGLQHKLLHDPEIKALLADGTLVERLAQQDLMGLFLNPHWRPLINRMQLLLSAEPSASLTTGGLDGRIPAPESVIPTT